MSKRIKWENVIFRTIAVLGILMFVAALIYFKGELSRTDTILMYAGILVLALLAIFCGGSLFNKRRRHKHHHHHHSSSSSSSSHSSSSEHHHHSSSSEHHHHSSSSSEHHHHQHHTSFPQEGFSEDGVKRTTSEASSADKPNEETEA